MNDSGFLEMKVIKLEKENEQLKQSLSQTSRVLQYGVKKVQRLAKENEQLKSDNKCYVKRYSELFEGYIACKKENEQLRKDLIDHSALIKMLEDSKALSIEDIIWNSRGFESEEQFDEVFKGYFEDAKKKWER